jgi:hypothetical protein
VSLVDTLQVDVASWKWAVFLLGGIIGIVIVKMLFELSLVIISSFAGASLITRALDLNGAKGLIILLMLILAGIVLQSARNRARPTAPPPPPPAR